MTLVIEGYQHACLSDLSWVEIGSTFHKVRECNLSLYAPLSTITYCGRRTSTVPWLLSDISERKSCAKCEAISAR